MAATAVGGPGLSMVIRVDAAETVPFPKAFLAVMVNV